MNCKKQIRSIVAICFVCSLILKPVAYASGFLSFNNTSDSTTITNYLKIIGSRKIITSKIPKSPIIIAIVDDGFNITAPELAAFIYTNPKESINTFDDDANGFKDDYAGWDISDNDNNLVPVKAKMDTYYHGTYIFGIVANILLDCYGDNASKYFKILPVKALGDQAANTYLIDGYKGIDYAVNMGAQIICCAWGSNVLKPEDEKIIHKAIQLNSCIIASAGNFNNSLPYYPAGLHGVTAVAATSNDFIKTPISNYGQFVSVSAPGEKIAGTYIKDNMKSVIQDGTSPSASIVTAIAAIIKFHFPKKGSLEIDELLKLTSISIDSLNPSYQGHIGAGNVSLGNVIDIIEGKKTYKSPDSKKHKGYIAFSKNKPNKWSIKPEVNGVSMDFSIANFKGNPADAVFKFYVQGKPSIEVKLVDWIKTNKINIDSRTTDIEFKRNKATKVEGFIKYDIVPLDSTKMYCGSKITLTELTDSISDGSGEFNYSNNCDCRWIISVTEGYRIDITFTELDTQPQIDNVYLYDGEYAIPEYAIARFSGPDLPPHVVSRTNKVLVWFLSDKKTTGKGWKLKYKAVKM